MSLDAHQNTSSEQATAGDTVATQGLLDWPKTFKVSAKFSHHKLTLTEIGSAERLIFEGACSREYIILTGG